MVGELPYNSWVGCMTILAYSGIEVTKQDNSVVGWDVFYSVLKLVVEVGFVIFVGHLSGSVANNDGQCRVALEVGPDHSIRLFFDRAEMFAHFFGNSHT